MDKTWVFLDALICTLETQPRFGAENDEPEGSRYIRLSDTFVLAIVRRLKKITDAMQARKIQKVDEIRNDDPDLLVTFRDLRPIQETISICLEKMMNLAMSLEKKTHDLPEKAGIDNVYGQRH